MKKILLTIVFVLTIVLGATAQTDGFFRDGNSGNYGNRSVDSDLPNTPSGVTGSLKGDYDAPLGSGLLILTALGAGYAVTRRREK